MDSLWGDLSKVESMGCEGRELYKSIISLGIMLWKSCCDEAYLLVFARAPSRTDIANYSNRLFKYLNDLVDLVVLCPDGTECDADAYGVKIRRISSVTSLELNGADVCIYNIGNNADFHSQIFEMLTLHPGVAILHDKCLLEFLGYLGLNNGTAISALDLRVSMGQWYGGRGLERQLIS